MNTDRVQHVSRQGEVVVVQLARQGASVTITLTPADAQALAQQLQTAAGSDAQPRRLVRE